jgi:beta-glucanase (GH16 family)
MRTAPLILVGALLGACTAQVSQPSRTQSGSTVSVGSGRGGEKASSASGSSSASSSSSVTSTSSSGGNSSSTAAGGAGSGSGSGSGSGAGSGAGGTTSSMGASGSGSGSGGWHLTWSDEFNAPDGTAPDASKWKADVGGWGFGNQELEFSTAPPANMVQRGGNLEITSDRAPPGAFTCWYGDCQYTSGKLTTLGLFDQKYGRFEARMRIPRGQGMWPAFWMMGSNITSVNWPACGEIDVMENIGSEPSTDYGTLHAPGYTRGDLIVLDGGALADDFHVYAVEWEPRVVRFYRDDALYGTRTPDEVPDGGRWPFDDGPFFLLINVAVGGGWPGSPDATTSFPQVMKVDYVRAYGR